MEEIDWERLGHVRRSKNRQKILGILQESRPPLTPKDISERMERDIRNVSKAILQLLDKELVECVTPEAKKTRMYKITKDGKHIFEMVQDIEKQQEKYRKDKQ